MKQKFLNSFYVLFLFTSIVQAQQTTRVVINSNDSGDGSLRKAIADANAGDTITFRVDVGHITLTTGQIEINKSLTIIGNGIVNTTIDGNANGRIFYIINSGDVILKDMMLTNGLSNGGSAIHGGAIYGVNTNLTITNAELSNNKATYGGGIANFSGALIMINCNLKNNTAQEGGALIGGVTGAGENIVNITGGNITGNTATTGHGGAIYIGTGTINLDKVTIASNIAKFSGGGLNILDAKLTITNSAIVNNTSEDDGGGLYFNSSESAYISTTTFSGNIVTGSDTSGGAIYNAKSLIFALDATTVANNSASYSGGGIYNNTGMVTLKNTIVAKNNATFGPDVFTNSSNKFKSSGYNLIGQDKSTAFTATTGDLVGTATAPIDPKIETLANNGGSTLTHKLLKGSLAYNAGDPADMYNDQINQTVFGNPIKRRDIGAYEAQKDLLGNTVFDFKNNSSKVWPNPSNGTIKINLSNRLGNTAKGSLIEMASGKTVSEFAINGNSEINLQNYAAGLYIVRLESESVTENHKLIIQ